MDTESSMGLLILELWASVGVQNLMVLMDSYTWVHVLLQFLLIFLYIYTQQKVCLLDIKDLSKFLFVNRKQHLYLTSPAAETCFLL